MGKTALLVVDMLNEALSGIFANDRIKSIVPPLVRLRDAAKEKNIPIIYANDAHIKGLDKELQLWGDHSIRNTEGSKVIDELTPDENDFIVPKRRYSSFFQTDLHLLLTELGVDTLIITGLLAHICVLQTAADAYFWGYNLIMPLDGTESGDEKDYEYSMNYFRTIYAAKTPTIDELIPTL